ncbi:MAG: polysaccharide biosynthesis/export family protein [Proteobacteria bacterium]|nr:polysaccharide biosynthesis/export family protein [Pseudomonadota bacterium]
MRTNKRRKAGVLAMVPLALAAQFGQALAQSLPGGATFRAAGELRPEMTPASVGVAPGQAKIPEIPLTSAERISIKIVGQSNLSGDYRIGPDNSISIPVIGRVSVEGIGAAELEKALAAKIGAAAGARAYVTVEILEYKPVFVTGFVSKPGSVPWRANMSVLHALALSGGKGAAIGAGDDTTAKVALGEEVEYERLQRAIVDQKRALCVLARLEAEKKQADKVSVPDALVKLVGPKEAKELIEAENSWLRGRLESIRAKRVAVNTAIKVGGDETKGLHDRSARIKSQIDVRSEYSQQIDGLAQRGIVRKERTMDEQGRVAELWDRYTEVAISSARIANILASLERDRITLELDYVVQLDNDIALARLEIDKNDIAIRSARASFRKLTGHEANQVKPFSGAAVTSGLKYRIYRPSAEGTPMLIAADQLTKVLPGDVVEVSVE